MEAPRSGGVEFASHRVASLPNRAAGVFVSRFEVEPSRAWGGRARRLLQADDLHKVVSARGTGTAEVKIGRLRFQRGSVHAAEDTPGWATHVGSRCCVSSGALPHRSG